MARIRTVKPEFFRNHKLYQAEQEEGLPLRLAFAGLWTAADRAGRFRWSPDELKLDCLPYDEVDFRRVLHALATRHYIVHYASGDASDDREYGCIPSWDKHQVINNRETASVLPQFLPENEIIDACATREPRVDDASRELPRGREGKGREGKGMVTRPAAPRHRPTKKAAPVVAVAPTTAEETLYRSIWESFQVVNGNFSNYPKEGTATKRLVQLSIQHCPDDPARFAHAVLTKFNELTKRGNSFWRGQPFTPSTLSSSAIFDRVLAEMKQQQADLSADWTEQ